MNQISTALEIYSIEHSGVYPVAPFWSYRDTFLASTTESIPGIPSLNNIAKISSFILPYMSDIPKDTWYGLTTNSSGECKSEGNFFAYYTDQKGKVYAMTSMRESKRGNTTNCKWAIDSEQGDFYVIWRGLTYKIEEPTAPIDIYNGTDDPVARCIAHLTDEEVPVLWALINQSSISKQNLCQNMSRFNITNKSDVILIPSAINKLVALEGIVIDGTSISNLPPLSNLRRLKQLQVRNNINLATPINLSNLPSLEYVLLEHNAIPSVTLYNLPALTQLLLQYNNISTFPSLSQVPALQLIYLNNNSISTLPDLSNYFYINTLQAYNNPIMSLSQSNCSIIAAKWYGINIWVNGINICA